MSTKDVLLTTVAVALWANASVAEQTLGEFVATDLERINKSLELSSSEVLSATVMLDDVPDDAPVPVAGTQFFTPWKGTEIEKVWVIEGGQKVERYWKALSPDVWRRELQNNFVQTEITDRKTGAEFSIPAGLNFSAKKGNFLLTYHNFRYKSYPCTTTNPHIGAVMVGVGVRIEIDAKFKNGSFSIGLTELALTASKNKVNGTIQADQVGLGNAKTLTQVVGATGSQVTYEGLVEASKAYAVANQAMEYMVELSNPQVFGFIDNVEPGACLKAFLSN
ncbi:hypothetical protein ACFMBG_00005 [Leisingera sp. D0M16]|uniref:hypothetical protein n=1 Tax=Leisingera coralii TaxID=3351347 RepID=UPI003B7FC6B4